MRHVLQKLNICVLALLLAAVMALFALPAAFADGESGPCGDDLSWTLNGDTLTITGSGAMWDFSESTMAPWYEYRTEISAVKLPEGLTRVGDLAFYDCSALKSVSLPDSVKEVGWYAFALCGGMTMLDLGDGLQEIEDSGFRECSSLSSIRIPNGLAVIGDEAFYRCESLTSITVPASVTEMGVGVFAYCYELLRADIKANITELPTWTFYGCARLTHLSLPETLTGADAYAFYECESLSDVAYSGSAENKAQIQEDIQRDRDGGHATVSDNENGNSTSTSTFVEDGEDIVAETVSNTQTENADISANITVTYPGGSTENSISSARVNITLENDDGWTEIADELADIISQVNDAQVDVYAKEEATALPGSVLDGLAGENVTLTFHAAGGAAWQVDCTEREAAGDESGYDFSYERLNATEKQTELLGGAVGYQIKFANDAEIHAEIMIKLPIEHAMQNAYLYQVERGELQLLQASVVDRDGYAHFYLAKVDSKTEYLIGINVPGEQAEEAIVPETLYADYGITDTAEQIEYVITGRTSSWGMTINQVTWILAAVLAACVTLVGLIMFFLNKQKLKKGYVAEYDDEA